MAKKIQILKRKGMPDQVTIEGKGKQWMPEPKVKAEKVKPIKVKPIRISPKFQKLFK